MINDTQSQFGGASESGTSGVTDQVKQLAANAQDQASEQVKSGFMTTKHRAADALQNVARALRTSSEQLTENAPGDTGRYVEQVSEQVQRFADFVEHSDASEMMHSAENFARRQPALFLGGAFALGLIGARFLKSSRRNASTPFQPAWQNDARRSGMYDQERNLAGFSEPSAGAAGTSGLGSTRRTGSPSATTDPLHSRSSGTDPLQFGSSTAGSALDDDRLGSSGPSTGGRGLGASGTTSGRSGNAGGAGGGTGSKSGGTDATGRDGRTTGLGPDATERR